MTYVIKEEEYLDEVLEHHGVKGQKWGVRRYQNEDGTLTEKGKKRYVYNLDLSDKSRKNIAKIRKGEARRRLDYAKLHGSSDVRKADLQGRLRTAKRTEKDVRRFDKGAKLAAKGRTITGNKAKVLAAGSAAVIGSYILDTYLDKRLKDLGRSGRLTNNHSKVATIVSAVGGLTLMGLAAGYSLKKDADNRNLRVYNNMKWAGESSMKRVGSQEYQDRLKGAKKKK